MGEVALKARKERLKEILRRLNNGEGPVTLKDPLRDILVNVTPLELSRLESELLREGISREELHRLCDVHLALFQESLQEDDLSIPAWHPLHILKEEHKQLLAFAIRLQALAKKAAATSGLLEEDEWREFRFIVGHLKDSETHHLREENVLFPQLEKHGITEPPAMLFLSMSGPRSGQALTRSATVASRRSTFERSGDSRCERD